MSPGIVFMIIGTVVIYMMMGLICFAWLDSGNFYLDVDEYPMLCVLIWPLIIVVELMIEFISLIMDLISELF